MHDINLVAGENAVLLLHGLASSPLEMRYVAKMLHRNGFSVSVPHIAGYGHGEPVTDWREWHAKALDAFTQLKREYRTVSVGGLCIGAVLALSLAAEKRREIAALSLLSTTLFYDGWAMPWYRFLLPLFNCAPLRNRSSFREREPYGVKNEFLRKRIARAMQHESLTAVGASSISMNHIYQATRLIGHVKRTIGAVETPALVMHAIDDDVASVKNADFIVDRIGSKIVRKVVLNDSYHIVTMDNERARVVDETSRFFTNSIRASVAGLRSGERARMPASLANAGLVAVAA
jgi:carboxylesterase